MKTRSDPRAVSKAAPKDMGIKVMNLVPLMLMLGLALILAYSFSFMLGGGTKPSSQSQPQAPLCMSGQTRQCAAGNCTGTSVCVDGSWSGCTWKQACVPGTAVPCLSDGCPQGLKRCNPCGTGYLPCSQS